MSQFDVNNKMIQLEWGGKLQKSPQRQFLLHLNNLYDLRMFLTTGGTDINILMLSMWVTFYFGNITFNI